MISADRYQVDPNSGCWLFSGSKHKDGYGLVKVDGRTRKAHRVMYEDLVGPVPPGVELDHLCRTPACINPAHLEPVSHLENVRRGAQTKLTAQVVAEIKAQPTVKRAVLAQAYGVSLGTIKAIRLGAVWRDIEAAA